jgi:hypothetical protein
MIEVTERRLETARRRAIGQRNYRRARDRALRKLANRYPELYQELLEEERKIDEQEGKAWLDIDGRTSRWVDVLSPDQSGGVSEGLNDKQDKGYGKGEA